MPQAARALRRPAVSSPTRPVALPAAELAPVPAQLSFDLRAVATVLHLRIPDFAVEVALRDRPALRGRPLVIAGDTAGRSSVLAASPEARAAGIETGMRLRVVEQLCPNVTVLPLDPRALVQTADTVLAALGRYTPQVEAEWQLRPSSGKRKAAAHTQLAAGLGVLLDVRGCERLAGSPVMIAARIGADLAALGYEARIGVASERRVAAVASALAGVDEPLVVPVGGERAFLAGLPIDRLEDIDGDLQVRLQELGFTRVGDLAALPTQAVTRRFGAAGKEAQERARALPGCPVLAPPAPAFLESTSHLEEPTGDLLLLQRLVGWLAARLARDLAARGQAASVLTLTLQLAAPNAQAAWSHTLHLKSPVAGSAALTARGIEVLNQLPASGDPVAAIALRLDSLVAAPTQLSFPVALTGGQPTRERLDRVAERLRQRFGPQAARRARLVDALLPEERVQWEDAGTAPRITRPRRLAVQADADGRPCAVRRSARGWEPVRTICAHWRLRSHWWAQETHRHYYLVETTGGTLLQIYHELVDDSWRLARCCD